MKTKSDEELLDFKMRFKEASIHMMLHIVIWAVVVYAILYFINNDIAYLIIGISSAVCFIFMVRRKVENEHLIVYSWICLMCVTLCGIAV